MPVSALTRHIRRAVAPERFQEMLQAAAGECNATITVDNAFAVICGDLGCPCTEHDVAEFFNACDGRRRCRAEIDKLVEVAFDEHFEPKKKTTPHDLCAGDQPAPPCMMIATHSENEL